jgi:ribonucleoside-triphosphate reductase
MNRDINTQSLLAEAKFYDAYSRWDKELNRYETWAESVDRVMNMHRGYYQGKMTPELSSLLDGATAAYKEKNILGAQRALQFGGDQLLKHPMRLYNCTSSYADRANFFGEYLYILLCGCGAGFSVQKHHVKRLPKISARNKQPKTHVVDDSIEGWGTALDVLMSSYFVGGGKHPEYEGRKIYFDLSRIRQKGELISGGFKAPGPDPLRRCLDRIEYLIQGLILKDISKLKPIHVYDICMHAADAVISGGVRRAATICLFSVDDQEMITAKTGNWFEENPQRGRSNNSAVIHRDEVTKESFHKIMESVKQFGEPGFFFVDDYDVTSNPCLEIGMYPQYKGKSGWQGCNLTEINGGHCDTKEKFLDYCKHAAVIGTIQAGYTSFSFIDDISKKIFEREALLGVSITGWMNNPKVLFDAETLEAGAKIVKETNELVAKMIGINPAARTTCVKPSGTASLLLETAAGIHADHSPKYIRNVQLNKESPIAKMIRKTNPHMVEDSIWSASGTDYAVSFPVVANKGSYFKDEFLGVKHLELVLKAQKHWVIEGTNEQYSAKPGLHHNVSNTITVDDWDAVEEYVFENRKTFTGVAFIAMTGDKDYNQAPNTEVLDEKEIVKKYGTGAIFASGLIVDALKYYDNLWQACSRGLAHDYVTGGMSPFESVQLDWIRRYRQFSENYFGGDIKATEYCLKDVYILHKWKKIQLNYKEINWMEVTDTKQEATAIDTMGGAACVGVSENGDIGCAI